MSKYSLESLYILPLSLRETVLIPPDELSSVWSPYRWIHRSFKQSQRQCKTVIALGSLSFSLSEPSLLSVLSLHIFSRTSQGTNPLFFPLATLMKPLCSSSPLTQIWKCVDTAALSSSLWWESKLEIIRGYSLVPPSGWSALAPYSQ